MRILRRAPIIAATALAAAALLMSCSDNDPDPTETTTTPTAPTTTPSTGAAPPTFPAAATPDPKGAEAFARYFWDVFNYTYVSGDTQVLRSISDDSCKFCDSVADDVDALTEKGSRTEGALAEVEQVIAPPVDVRESFALFARVGQSKGQVLSASGEVLGESPAQPAQRSDMRLQYMDRWIVQGVAFGGPGATP